MAKKLNEKKMREYREKTLKESLIEKMLKSSYVECAECKGQIINWDIEKGMFEYIKKGDKEMFFHTKCSKILFERNQK